MLSIPQRVLGEGLFNSAKIHPAKTAIIAKGEEYSFALLNETAQKLAFHLINAGVVKGDRVAIYMDNSWQSMVSVYATTLAGAAFLVINPQTKSEKLQYILNDSEAKILISAYALRNEFSRALKDATTVKEIIITGSEVQINIDSPLSIINFEDAISNSRQTKLPNVIANDLAALIYTSGSTGFPKGVMMTHQSMVFTCWSLVEYLRLSEDDRIMLLLPLAFDYGLYQLLMAVTIGGSLVVEQSFIFIANIYKNIQKYRPTVFPGVPTIYAMMIEAAHKNELSFECIKKITNTAALLPAEFIPSLKKIFPNALIFKMYGLTECKRVCYLEPELIDIKPTSVGKAIPGTEVFLLSPKGEPVAAGTARNFAYSRASRYVGLLKPGRIKQANVERRTVARRKNSVFQRLV